MIKIIIYCTFIGFLLTFSFCSIIMNSVDLTIWTAAERFYMVIVSCLISILVLMIYFVTKERGR